MCNDFLFDLDWFIILSTIHTFFQSVTLWLLWKWRKSYKCYGTETETVAWTMNDLQLTAVTYILAHCTWRNLGIEKKKLMHSTKYINSARGQQKTSTLYMYCYCRLLHSAHMTHAPVYYFDYISMHHLLCRISRRFVITSRSWKDNFMYCVYIV